jgi:amino acid transporter
MSPPSTNVQAQLARERLGALLVACFVVASMGPFLVTAGLVPTAYATASLTGVPAAFLAVAAVLAVFAVGYVAMGQRIRNAGAFYAYVSHGLGRPAGVGAAFVAVVSYNLMQVAIYGAIGTAAASFFADNGNVHLSWWAWALLAWAMVAGFGLAQVRVSSALLGVLSGCEIAIALTLSARGLKRPAGGHVSFTALSPTSLHLGPTLGALIGIAVLSYVGFEQAVVYTEEARNPRRTILQATFLSLAGLAVVYALASWAMDVHYGAQTVAVAQAQGPGMLFGMAPGPIASAGRSLYLTALFAASLAFHNAVWRYMYSLGREHVLPGVLARTVSGIPRGASVAQSGIGLCVIAVTVAFHWDPMSQLFYWAGTAGGFGILVLLALTSVAALVFFARTPRDATVWQRILAPALSAAALGYMTYLCARNFATLLGVPATSQAAVYLPALFPLVFLLGIGLALYLRAARPEVYARIGLGPDTALADTASDTASRATPAITEGTAR